MILDFLEDIRGVFIFLYTQFVGSETQEPYSESYIWMANQFGHFFIGFGGLFVLTWLMSFIRRKPAPSYSYGSKMVDPTGRQTLSATMVWMLAALWFAVWMSKEWLFDYLLMSREASQLISPFNNDLVFDTATDCFFYTAGIIVALAHFGMLRISPLPILFYSGIAAFLLALYWLPEREKIETAGTPYFIRLSGPELGVEFSMDGVDGEDFLSKIQQETSERKRGLMSAVEESEYPLDYMMESPLTRHQQIIAVSDAREVMNRLGTALTNERVVRRQAREACSSRFITFRDLMDSEVKNTDTASDPNWTIETVKNGSPALSASNGNPIAEGFPDVRCPLENAEFLVVDQVPSVEIAATLITGLVTFPDSGQQQLRIFDRVGPTGASSYTAKERMDQLAQTVESQGERNMEAFLRAMSGKIVIWLIDNERIVDDWRRLLLRYYDFNQVRIMDPTTE
jgi:hypothetical protein